MQERVLLPRPKSVEYRDGAFAFAAASLEPFCGDQRVETALTALYERYHDPAAAQTGTVFVSHEDGAAERYTLDITPVRLEIRASSAGGAFYALQTLGQLLLQGAILPCMHIEDAPDFAYRGFYHDVTRGRIPTLASLKELADRLAAYKLNSLQLYVEHTFAFKEYAEINTGQEPLTAEEIRELDAYCRERFIDLVPSLSTFGHLYALLQSERYRHLCELEDYVPSSHLWLERMQHHTLDATSPESLKLVYALIDQYLPLFSSRYFNICCDETFDLCRGRNKGKNKAELYVRFVSALIAYVESKGRTAMLWGDIVLEHSDCLPDMSEKALFLNWDYKKEPTEENVRKIAQTGHAQIVCPGTWGWGRLLEYLPESVGNIRTMAALGKAYGARGVLNTSWGDFGHTCDPLNVSYGLILGAAESWNTGALDEAAFERAVSILHYRNENGAVLRAVHELNACDSMNAWMQLFYLFDARKKGVEYDFKSFTAEELREKIVRCRRASENIIAELRHGDADAAAGEALIVAADGQQLWLRMLKGMMTGEVDATLLEDLDDWIAVYTARWKRENKPDELPLLLDYLNEWKKLLKESGCVRA